MEKHNLHRSICVSAFFLIFLILGLSIYKDFGVSWDEPRNRINGLVSLKYVSNYISPDFLRKDKTFETIEVLLPDYVDRDYGVAFELPLVFIERILDLQDSQDIYFFRHLVTFLFCFAGLFALYRLCARRFDDWRVGLLGALFLILSPRFFAESFYNSKDLVFMALFTITLNETVRYLIQPTTGNACRLSFFTALLIDVRLMGIIVPIVTFTILIIRLFRNEVTVSKALSSFLVYLTFGIILTIAFWPYLWADPFTHFIEAFNNMMKFRWLGLNLYLGEFIQPSELPWHYLPVWIGITTPIFHLICFLFGVRAILGQIFSHGIRIWTNVDEMQDILFLGIFICSIASIIGLNSVLYDGWRQMYFIYPVFLLVAIRGWVAITHLFSSKYRNISQLIFIVITLACLSYTGLWMVRYHPFQNIYFNALIGANKKIYFDVDYWGLSSRQALQYIADNDENTNIKIWAGSRIPLSNGKLLLDTQVRKRLHIVKDEDNADYVITQYRLNLTDYGPAGRGYESYYDILVDGEAIISVYKRK